MTAFNTTRTSRTMFNGTAYRDRAAPRFAPAKFLTLAFTRGPFIELAPGSNCPGWILWPGRSAPASRFLDFSAAFAFARWRAFALVMSSSSFLESVREVYVFKHSFLSMRRIDAKSRKARAVLVRFSKSLASRRHLPSQANVLSTTHPLGMTSKPTAVSDRLTISVSKWGKIFFRAWSNTGPWYPPSAKSFFRNGNLPNKVPRTRTPPSRSWILAGCTMACTNRPTVSTRMWRFLPLIFLPAS